MKITYDAEVDAMSIFFRKGTVTETIEVTPFVLVHLDNDGHALNVELLGISQFADAPDKLELTGLTAESTQSHPG
jgi:uncharacterized protein YuzE